MISVIVPVFNADRFVQKAVESACEQKEVSEIILIEDGSSDSSLDMCKKLVNVCTEKVLLFQHDRGRNRGAGASRNLGIKKSKAEFVAFLDADDYYLPNRFEQDLNVLQKDPSIDGVYNALGVHIHDDEERDRIKFNLTTVKYPIPPAKLFEEMAPIGGGGYFSGVALTVRRTIFDKVGLFDSTLEVMQDTHMWIKMAAKASLVAGVIDRAVAMRGVHIGNRVKDTDKFNYYRPFLYLSLLKWAEQSSISEERKIRLWNCLYWAYRNSVHSQRNSMLRKNMIMYLFLVRLGIRYPYLLKYQNYRVAFSRLLK